MAKAARHRLPARRAVLVFLLAVVLCAALIVGVIRNRMHVDRVMMEQLILEKSSAVSQSISRLLYKTQALAALAIQSDGEVSDFEHVAAALVDDPAILNVLLAPDGVVSRVYPLEGNEDVLGLDFFQEGAGNKEARLAKETGDLVFGGPFTLVQGGQALVGRLPVWKETGSTREFWGIVSVTLRYPDALEAAALESIEGQGLSYEIWRINPDDNQRQVVGRSPDYDPDALYIEKEVSIVGAKWYFRIAPVRRWYQYGETWLMGAAALCVCLLAAYIVESNLRLRQMQRTLEQQEVASRRAARTAEEASRMKTTFLATVSHEIRTPMNAIIGFSDLAAEDAGATSPIRAHLINITRSAKGLMQIIDDLLDISKIEAGKVELEAIPFTVQKVFEECATMGSPRAAEKGLALRVHADEAAQQPILGDPTKLRQILLNLLSNAIKFTGIGAVEMTCRLVREDDDTVDLRFSVKDSGIGMTKEQIARIGEPFLQADSSTTRKYGGTGLGLSITTSLIRLMGGELVVQSEPSIGSRFSFTIRFRQAGQEALAAREAGHLREAPDRRPLFRGRVLLCEDTPANQELVCEHLRRAGLAVTVASNGQEGLDAAREAARAGMPFDLIFMDIYMPVMDGIEAARQLRAEGDATPIVAMTANVMASDRAQYREAGMEAYLAKPFTADELRRCLQKLLEPVAYEPLPRQEEAGAGEVTVIHRDLGLRVTDGDEGWYQRLLIRFVSDNADFYQKLVNAVRREDGKLVCRLAHSLKGNANMIGAARLASAAARVEQAVTQQEGPASLEKQMALLEGELNAVLFELQAEPVPAEHR